MQLCFSSFRLLKEEKKKKKFRCFEYQGLGVCLYAHTCMWHLADEYTRAKCQVIFCGSELVVNSAPVTFIDFFFFFFFFY